MLNIVKKQIFLREREIKMILPLAKFKGNSSGEELLWNKCKEFLPNDYVSFHNYYISGIHQADVIVLMPNYGVLIIEIKSYKAKNILSVPDRTMILKKNGNPEMSPYEQVIGYRNHMIHSLSEVDPNLGKVYVSGAVCYPYINEKEYEGKHLDKISSRKLTILQEDIKTADSFINKLTEIYEYIYQEINAVPLEKYSLDKKTLNILGNLICPNFRKTEIINIKEDISENNDSRREIYSRLNYFDENESLNTINIEKLESEWLSGTKLWLFFANKDLLKDVIGVFNKVKEDNNLLDKKVFGKNEDTKFFCFIADCVDIKESSFEISNGEVEANKIAILSLLSKASCFNYEQYKLEHADLTDLIVKAGAGTGKTYSLVSRINYLCWEKGYTSDELLESIVMVTFTNDAANSMKEKLMKNFLNYFILTKNIVFLSYADAVENMKISTIHSLAKTIIKGFSAKLGLGETAKITTGQYKRSKILHEVLNKYFNSNKMKIDGSIYQLEKELLALMDKLDNNNIDLALERKKIDIGEVEPPEMDFIFDVISETKIELEQEVAKENKILLGSLITKLKELVIKLKIEDFDDLNIDFVFVDEFQDTDDVQIKLICEFKKLLGFKLFVVGDIKQCIYRFRGADEVAFDKLANYVPESFKYISLKKNYRTDKKLMDQFNKIFCKWDYEGDIKYNNDDVLEGTVEQEKIIEYKMVTYTDENFEKNFLELLNNAINYANNEDASIAILVRYNWQVGKIKDICKAHSINIETSAGGDLFKLDSTIDLLKLLEALKNHKNPEYLYSLYTTAYVDENLNKIDLWEQEGQDLYKTFSNNPPNSLKKWNEYIDEIAKQPLLKVLRDIIDDVAPWDIFGSRIGGEKEAIKKNRSFYMLNLDQLFERIVSTFSSNYLTINTLIDYLKIMILTMQEEDERETFNVSSEAENKLICTTVHKSKGLEYDTVIMPFCDFNIESKYSKGKVDLFYVDEEGKRRLGFKVSGKQNKTLIKNNYYGQYRGNEYADRAKEETRVLYVSMTRAISKFYFMKYEKGSKTGKYWSSMMEVRK